MKLLALTAAIVTLGSVTASAEPWDRDRHERVEHGRYLNQERRHDVCQEKAERLHQFQHRASSDGRLDFRERRIIERLRHDLHETCGGNRWHG